MCDGMISRTALAAELHVRPATIAKSTRAGWFPPLSITRIRRAFAIAHRLASITRTVRMHDLRHTFATRLAARALSSSRSRASWHTRT